MPTLSLRRWFRRSSFAATSTLRIEVYPPSLRQAPDSAWQRLTFWLFAPSPRRAAPPTSRLTAVREEFNHCLHDVPTQAATELLRTIALARSLRELWHLRSDVYRLVALQHSQAQAEARLASLNHHFPTRAPRSGFAPL